jgi:hypothetical protein
MSGRPKQLGVKAAALRPRNVVLSIFPPNVQFELAVPSSEEAAAAHRVLAFLEDRRVLYAPEQMETADECVRSVLEMRHFLTEVIGELAPDSELGSALRVIRAACRKFLDECDGPAFGHGMAPWRYGGDWVLGPALGELRGVTGVCVAAIADRYGLDVEPELTAILPAAPTDQD